MGDLTLDIKHSNSSTTCNQAKELVQMEILIHVHVCTGSTKERASFKLITRCFRKLYAHIIHV